MLRKSLFIILIVLVTLLTFTSTITYANNNDLIEIKEVKEDNQGPLLVLGIIAIIEIAFTSLIISKHKDNPIRSNLVLLVIFGILSVIAAITGVIVTGIIANAKHIEQYVGIHHFAIQLFPITFIPFVISIICLPISIIIKRKKKKLGA